MVSRCLICDMDFNAKRSDAKYCSNACRVIAYRARNGNLRTHTLERVRTNREAEFDSAKTAVESLEDHDRLRLMSLLLSLDQPRI